MRELLSGFIAAGAFVGALSFLRFWRLSRERLFLLFGAAFAVMSVNHVALAMTSPDSEARVALYVVRLISFLLILAGIVDRNRD